MEASEYKAEIDRRKVEDILAGFKLPEEIQSIDTTFGRDHTGDPAIFLTFSIRDGAPLQPEDMKRLSRFLSEVVGALLDGGVVAFPYTRLQEAA